MRVTNNMLSHNLLRNLEHANNKMVLLQDQLSTGKRITKPSDDPVGTETSLRLTSTINSMEQWKKNASEALSCLNSTEGILGNMTSMLQRVRELTVKGATSQADEDRGQIAKEIDQLTMQFQSLANSQVNNKYIFSGSKINIAPVEAYTGTGTPPALSKWHGNDNVIEIEVGPNVNMPVAIKGSELFGITFNDVGTEANSSFFNTLNKLSTSLSNGDTEAINECLDEVDGHLDNLLALRSQLGARTNRMETIYDQLDNSIINAKQHLSTV